VKEAERKVKEAGRARDERGSAEAAVKEAGTTRPEGAARRPGPTRKTHNMLDTSVIHMRL
jgi:hypothetical protein